MLSNLSKIHFVGIGGIGTSGLARFLHAHGAEISGSDFAVSEITEALGKEGINVQIGHQRENLPKEAQAVIYSAAIPADNPERMEAAIREIRQYSYAEALGEATADKKVIAVSGTNGKTTTTAMIAHILEFAGRDPSAIVGSIVNSWNTNFRAGKGEYFVVEADEYARAFLNLKPFIGVILNILPDHLDYYKDFDDIKNAFTNFAENITPDGVLIYNQKDGAAERIAARFKGKSILFKTGQFELSLPGDYNRENASAAAAAAKAAGADDAHIQGALKTFTGTWRRFQIVGKIGKTEIVSDYAHHPDGLEKVLAAVSDRHKGGKVLAVFQPHQHNRTKTLFQEFVIALSESGIHDFIIPEIFDVAGREEDEDQNVSSADLADALEKAGKNAKYALNLEETERIVRFSYSKYDAVIFLGAGNIYKVAEKLVK